MILQALAQREALTVTPKSKVRAAMHRVDRAAKRLN
jgi:hypothetical protein